MKRMTTFAVCAAVCLSASLHTPVQAREAALSKRIIGYYINWGMYAAHNQYSPQDIPWTKITHINYAFAQIVSDTWAIQGTDDWADIQCGPQQNGQIGQINTLKRQYGVKTMISVGGWTRSGNFSAMAATAAGRAAFAIRCARYIKQYGFDGVDIDWEYPCFVRPPDPNLTGDQGCNGLAADKSNYTLMLQTLRTTLDSAGKADGTTYYISIAAPGGYDKTDGPVTFQEPDKYNGYIDWMNVMSYDFHGGWDSTTGHLAALYQNPHDPFPTSPVDIKDKYNGDAIVRFYQSKGVPAAKINIGAAYYGRSWKSVSDGGTGGLFQPGLPRDFYETTWNYGVEPYYTLKGWETNGSCTYGYDNSAKAPYLYNSSAKLFYTYDNEQSISDKCDYAASRQLGGVFFWEFTGDYPPKGSTLTSLIFNKLSSVGNVPRVAHETSLRPTPHVRVSGGTLVVSSQESSPVSIRLYDISGRLLNSFVLDQSTPVRETRLPAGVYFCRADAQPVIKVVVRGE
jgi:chitinase